MTNKKIIFCSSSYYEYDRRIQRIIGALREEGYEISWISRQYDRGPDSLEEVDHYIIRTIFNRGPLFYFEFQFKLLILLLFQTYDVISTVDLDTVLPSYLASIFRRKLIVFDAHEIFYEVPELNGKKIKKRIWKFLAKITIPKIHYNYTVNASLKKHYEENYQRSFAVIRNVPNLDPETKSLTEDIKPRNIIYLGALNKGRGLELAIDAMEELMDYKLILVGEGDLSELLKRRAGTSKAKDRIEFRGFVNPNSIFDLLNRSWIGINILSANCENYRLSLGNKFFDYMHACIPSINMDFPEYRIINRQYKVSYLLSEMSIIAYVTAIRSFENEDVYREYTLRCAEASKEYNWQKEKEKLKKLYAQIN